MKRLGLLTLASLALTVASVAPTQAATGKCQPHAVAYEVSGTLISGTLTLDAGVSKTYSGTVTVLVIKTNEHAKADKGLTKAYTLSHVDVSFGAGVNKTAPAAGSRIHLKGTITRLEKKCTQTGFTATTTVTKVALHRA